MNAPKNIAAVQADHEAELMALPGVVGVAVGESEGKPCLLVYVEQLTPELKAKLPADLEGYKVEIEESGPIFAQPDKTKSSPPTPQGDIFQVWQKHERDLMTLPGVIGVAVGECGNVPCLKVYVETKTAVLAQKIPHELDGFKVEVEESGPVNIQPQT